jgi:hypothetical protein
MLAANTAVVTSRYLRVDIGSNGSRHCIQSCAGDEETSRALDDTFVLFRQFSGADPITANSLGTASRLKSIFEYSVAAIVNPAVSDTFKPRSWDESGATLAAILSDS